MHEPPRGPIHLDSSAWVKFYWPEVESDVLNAALVGRRDVLVSDLGVTEVVSALARRVRAEVAPALGMRMYRSMLEHIQHHLFATVELTSKVHRDAERSLLSPATPALRAADALHLALAREAQAATLACFDKRMRSVAAALGFLLFPA